MKEFKEKAKDFFTIGKISQELKKFDVACSNYFNSLAAISDYLLAQKNLFAKDHFSRFNLLKETFPEIYKTSSSLYLIYRKTYTKQVDKKETEYLYKKVKEVFENARVKIPSNKEIEDAIKKVFR